LTLFKASRLAPPLELHTKRLHHKLDQSGTNIDISIKNVTVCFHDGQYRGNVLSDYQIITKKEKYFNENVSEQGNLRVLIRL
jgi:hypothetical protein